MRVDVDEAGRNDKPAGINDAGRLPRVGGKLADGGDAIARNSDVGRARGRARSPAPLPWEPR